MLLSDLLLRRKTHFTLWLPNLVDKPPVLVIGTSAAGNPNTLANRRSGQDLLRDCILADKLEPHSIPGELGMNLEELYESQIRRMNWSIHGAGYAAVHLAPERWFLMNCALAFKWSSDLSMLIAEMTMRTLRITEALDDLKASGKG